MNAAPEIAQLPAEDISKWSKSKKLAALVLMLEPESGAHVLRTLDERELEEVSVEMVRFNVLSQHVQAEILREFSSVALEAATNVPCSLDRVQSLLTNSVGAIRASEIVCRTAPSRPPMAAMQPIIEMDSRQLAAVLRYEQLQTIVVVVSFLPPEKASEILLGLKPDVREQVIQRLATLAPAPFKVVEDLADELKRKFGAHRAYALNQTGGVKVAAQVLNALPRNVGEGILTSMKERNTVLWEEIRQKMFTFEELQRLDRRILTRILQAVNAETLTVALRTASDPLKEKLLSCVSKRAAQTLREEIEAGGPVKLRESEAAQFQIMESVRQLEAEGEIDPEEMRGSDR